MCSGRSTRMKLHSSMTLFAQAAPDEPVFREVLDHYFGGALDEGTTSRLRGGDDGTTYPLPVISPGSR